MVGNQNSTRWSGGISALLLCCVMITTLRAAEVRGTVEISRQGLFKADEGQLLHPVAVALLPADGQRMRKSRRQTYHINISDNRMRPAFLAIQRGSRVEIINHDDVYHQLFSVSPGDPVSVQLGKAGIEGQDRSTIQFSRTGTTHLFCRIHKKSYARVDVVDTPYLQMVEPGQVFRFTGLTAGDWKLRLSAPAAETRWLRVTALTSPPPLQLKLTAYGGGSRTPLAHSTSGIEQLYGSGQP